APPQYAFPGAAAACARTAWKPENTNVYLKCGGIFAGMTSIVSQIKVCLKMALDAGVHLVLPTIPLRDSTDLTNFNFFNGSANMDFDRWFDEAHLRDAMARACPQLKIRKIADFQGLGDASTELAAAAAAAAESGEKMAVAHEWNFDINTAPGLKLLAGYFWVGRPFRTWFEHELLRERFLSHSTPKTPAAAAAPGATIINIVSQFLVFRITDDATGRELALWNDLSAMVRFNEATRAITTKVEARIDQPYIGVHFRVEKDNIWSSYDDQLKQDLDALDKLWTRYGGAGSGAAKENKQQQQQQQGAHGLKKPLVYLACGDEEQIKGFEAAAALRGWNVTSKYDIVKNDAETLRQLKELPFDFQGAVDLGIMLKSWFFVGITGSAFSSTVANLRDSTGRYRGSSLQFPDDDHARTHLFNDGDAAAYACCL
ncbi:hypothetical protein BD289DRAFT_357081, partial [Coniella lustricola]